MPEFDPRIHLVGDENELNKDGYFEDKYISTVALIREQNSRYDGLRIVVGQNVLDSLAYARLFMVGAGAIGCELLKNYAMIGVGTGKKDL